MSDRVSLLMITTKPAILSYAESYEYRVSTRRACRVLLLARSTFRCEPVEDKNVALRARIREIALTRVRYVHWFLTRGRLLDVIRKSLPFGQFRIHTLEAGTEYAGTVPSRSTYRYRSI